MSRDTTVIPFRQPETIDDPLTEIAREGARRMLAQVLIAEADAFVAGWRDRVVRHGHGPQRAIQTGVGPVEVRRAKVRTSCACSLACPDSNDITGTKAGRPSPGSA
jgi:putative transposase